MRNTVFSPGDYVRFLNEKQEGTVRTVLASGVVVVDIEDGFPVEVLPSELVNVKDAAGPEGPANASASTTTLPAQKPVQSLASIFPASSAVFIAVIPTPGQITQGILQLWLVNGTSSVFLFTFSSRQKKQITGIHYGTLLPGEDLLIYEKERSHFTDIDALVVEGLFFGPQKTGSSARLIKEFLPEFPDITQRFPSLDSPYAFARLQPVFNAEEPEDENLPGMLEKLKSELTGEVRGEKAPSPTRRTVTGKTNFQQYQVQPAMAEIDLHIEELVKSVEGMSNADMLHVQLSHFRKTLDAALIRRQSTIVFIHGVGNGVLRQEIRKELKELGLKHSDASHALYGGGATEVHLDSRH